MHILSQKKKRQQPSTEHTKAVHVSSIVLNV